MFLLLLPGSLAIMIGKNMSIKELEKASLNTFLKELTLVVAIRNYKKYYLLKITKREKGNNIENFIINLMKLLNSCKDYKKDTIKINIIIIIINILIPIWKIMNNLIYIIIIWPNKLPLYLLQTLLDALLVLWSLFYPNLSWKNKTNKSNKLGNILKNFLAWKLKLHEFNELKVSQNLTVTNNIYKIIVYSWIEYTFIYFY